MISTSLLVYIFYSFLLPLLAINNSICEIACAMLFINLILYPLVFYQQVILPQKSPFVIKRHFSPTFFNYFHPVRFPLKNLLYSSEDGYTSPQRFQINFSIRYRHKMQMCGPHNPHIRMYYLLSIESIHASQIGA